jgi:hypothetical protein
MTTTPVTGRPDRIKFSGHTADDGLFGPDSVTWRISALPQMGLAAHGAATLQMLNPMLGIAVAGLMNAEQRQIYGVDRPGWQFEANRQILKGIFEAEARKIPVLSRISLERQKVDEKAFGSAH